MPEQFEPRDPDFERRTRASFVRQAFMAELGAEMRTVRPGYVEIASSSMPFQIS